MRKVKFRGKRVVTDGGRYIEKTEGREWVYGSLIEIGEDNVFIFQGYKGASTLSKAQIVGWGMIAIDYETVGQFTKTEDRKEKEVYGGDIVKQRYFYEGFHPQTLGVEEKEAEIIGVVKIDGRGTYTETADGSEYYWAAYLECASEQLEVIGNIYDNPELLQEAKQ